MIQQRSKTAENFKKKREENKNPRAEDLATWEPIGNLATADTTRRQTLTRTFALGSVMAPILH